MGLPRRSELAAATFGHLGAAADGWERIGESAEAAFADLACAVRAHGGIDWRGVAGTAAVERTAADLVTIRGYTMSVTEAAAIARLGLDSLTAGQQQALDAISAAEGDGFAVAEDYSVTDTRPVPNREALAARQAAAQAHSAYIRHQVSALAANEAELTTRLKAATAGFGALSFADSGEIRLVDNETSLAPPPQGHVTVCEPYTAGGGFVCWDWYLDGSIARGWSPTDRSGGYP